ncbi:MAG: hypothetical protein V1788_03255, partial [Nanoarchaeota archaeon]
MKTYKNKRGRKPIYLVFVLLGLGLVLGFLEAGFVSAATDNSANNEIIDVNNLTINATVDNFATANCTSGNVTTPCVQSSAYNVVINRPVKWQKKISTKNLSEISVELPGEAENISVKTGDAIKEAELRIEQEREAIKKDKNNLITGKVVLGENKKFILFEIWNRLIGRITGKVSGKIQSVVEKNGSKIVRVNLNNNFAGALIEYTTPGPVSNEVGLSNGKRVTISAKEELNYTNALAYSELDNQVLIENKNKIKVYHLVNDSRENVNFEVSDLDNDGNIDYIEWIVPHLSEQVYEIIYITKAEHLDENRNFVSDIYEKVKAKDDVWSEPINNGEYVRVTFEQNLTNKKDITLYARASSVNNETECYD